MGFQDRAIRFLSVPGELENVLVQPLVPWTPRWITPNQITTFNMLVAFVYFYVASIVETGDKTTSILLCLFCAVANYVSMVLDCLDGMHARNTKQTSVYGELLDHGFDALSTGLLGGALFFVLSYGRRSRPLAALPFCLYQAIYIPELITQYVSGVYPLTIGPVAQGSISILWLIRAFLHYFYDADTLGVPYTWPMSCVVIFVVYRSAAPIVEAFNKEMWRLFTPFVIQCAGFSMFYVFGGCSICEYVMLMSCNQFCYGGGLVGCKITKEKFNSRFYAEIWVWLPLLFISLALSEPLHLKAIVWVCMARLFFNGFMYMNSVWKYLGKNHPVTKK